MDAIIQPAELVLLVADISVPPAEQVQLVDGCSVSASRTEQIADGCSGSAGPTCTSRQQIPVRPAELGKLVGGCFSTAG